MDGPYKVSPYGLVNKFIEAREEPILRRLLARFHRYELLILDDSACIPFGKAVAELLFQVLADRHEKKRECKRRDKR